MTTLFEHAYAKLNLTLDVLGKREDGYHDLQSVMQTVSLCDDLEIDIETGKPWCLKCDKDGIPVDEKNLAWKAARLYCSSIQRDPNGLEIRITKRIPSQAGMAGGSADAAAVLRALNRYYGEPLTLPELAQLGAQVGSDVPFCTICGTVMAEGRGERLRKLPDMPECIFVICKPAFSVSTPSLFKKIDEIAISARPDNRSMEQAIMDADLEAIARHVCNVFDPVVSAEHREITHIKSVFLQYGAAGAQMTGSGSACFAIMTDPEKAERICRELSKTYHDVFCCKNV